MPRKSARLRIQEIKQPSTADTHFCLDVDYSDADTESELFFLLVFIMSSHIPFEVQTSWDVFFHPAVLELEETGSRAVQSLGIQSLCYRLRLK